MSDANDVTVVPAELVLLSQTCLGQSQHLDDAWRAAEGGLQNEPGVAGDSPDGPRLVDAHAVCVESAASAVGYLRAVLELDTDLLQQLAFDFSGVDEGAATAFAASQVGL